MKNFYSYTVLTVLCIVGMNVYSAQDSIIIDNSDSLFSKTGSWNTSTRDKPFHGKNYLWARNAVKSTATWTLPVSKDGEYEILIWFCASMDGDRSSTANYTINHKTGSKTITISQKPSARLNNRWHSLGSWEFSSSSEKSARNITLDNSGADHSVSADAVKAVYLSKTIIPSFESSKNHSPFIALHGKGDYTLSWGSSIHPTSVNLYQIPTGKLIHQWTNLPGGLHKMIFTLGRMRLAPGTYTLVLLNNGRRVHLSGNKIIPSY